MANTDNKTVLGKHLVKVVAWVKSNFALKASVPTSVASLSDGADYAKKADLGTAAAEDKGAFDASGSASSVQQAVTGSAETDTKDSLTLNGLKKAVAEAAAAVPDGVVTDDVLEAKGYQTATNVDDAITAKGYQTESQVATKVESYGYQTAQQVSDAIGTAVASAYKAKGSVADYDALTAIAEKATGDVYNVVAEHDGTPAGTNYVWNGEAWDALGGTIDWSGMALTDQELDDILADDGE